MLIAQLAAEGKLTLEDKLIRHLPDYPDRAIAEQVTLQQLLAHRSGLGDIFNERFTPEAAARAAHARRLSAALHRQAARVRARYGAALFERRLRRPRAGGRADHRQAVRRRRARADLRPGGHDGLRLAGARRPACRRCDRLHPRGLAGGARASGAGADPQTRPKAPLPPRHANSLDLPAIGSSAGGSYSTARDLLAFARALATNRLARARSATPNRAGSASPAAPPAPMPSLEADFRPGRLDGHRAREPRPAVGRGPGARPPGAARPGGARRAGELTGRAQR